VASLWHYADAGRCPSAGTTPKLPQRRDRLPLLLHAIPWFAPRWRQPRWRLIPLPWRRLVLIYSTCRFVLHNLMPRHLLPWRRPYLPRQHFFKLQYNRTMTVFPSCQTRENTTASRRRDTRCTADEHASFWPRASGAGSLYARFRGGAAGPTLPAAALHSRGNGFTF